ncbi:hypothetical protein TNIN_123291 [Trichonephila inaurata madagascariensis]|uniref:Uncharacterized protein n=1 Tax=Trichonephila inaurata madagascariensis TaxID=2747483 RepID=A0A8X6X9R0_9ARAC|nr:hypothetical protein TNIN_123291 [Trichonephila inaurata madagascariensis]
MGRDLFDEERIWFLWPQSPGGDSWLRTRSRIDEWDRPFASSRCHLTDSLKSRDSKGLWMSSDSSYPGSFSYDE